MKMIYQSVINNSDKDAASIFSNLAFQVLIRGKVSSPMYPSLSRQLQKLHYIGLVQSFQRKKHC